MSSAIQQIAAQLVRLERNVMALSTTPALAYSSIEDGGSIDSNADDGGTMAQFGGQFDGSYMAASLVGPTPPTPSAPIVTPAIGGLTVQWDGTFTDALYAPMDFTRVEVHVSIDAGFDALSAATLAATVETPRGATLFIPRAPGAYYVAFVARSQSGAAGLKSATVGPTTINNSVVIPGTLNVTGDTVIGGTLSLPAGIIDNAALANPVASQAIFATTSNFGLTTATTTKLSLTITVPDGFTSAAISVIGRVFAYNNNAGVDYLFARTDISGYVGPRLPLVATGSGGSALNVAPFAKVLTGLTPGETFAITVAGDTSFASWATFVENTADLTGIINWYR